MPHAIRFLEHPPLRATTDHESRYYDGTVDFGKFAIGDLCFYHYQGKPCTDRAYLENIHLTQHYFSNNAQRPPLILAMPDAASKTPRYFLVDGQCYSNKCTRCGQRVWDKCKCPGDKTPRGYHDGWTVSGAPPAITVSPSVNFDDEDVKHYHGFIQNGVIGDG